MDAERIADEVAGRVRELVAGAQNRAEEIVRAAEAEAQRLRDEAAGEAQRIRDEAEAQARERLDQVRHALEQLETGLGAKRATQRSQIESEAKRNHPQEESEAPEPEPAAAKQPQQDPEAPEPEPAADEQAPPDVSTDELIERLKAGGDSATPHPGRAAQASNHAPGDDAGAVRLVAMKLALDGTSRDEARRQLAADYDVVDLDSLLDEVYAKAGR